MHDALLVAGGVVLAALGAKSKDVLKGLLDFLGQKLLDRFVSHGLFTRKAVRVYVHRLYEEHRQFNFWFQPESVEQMDMRQVYVRLSLAAGTQGGHAVSASLADKNRTVVLGAPGAGKTMLLRNTALTWAYARYRPGPPRRTWYGRRRPPVADVRHLKDVPVLLPLRQLDPTVALRDQIISHLGRRGFRNAGRWLDRMLDSGGIDLYFDGLDEVATAHRFAVVDALREFLAEYPSCRSVVTCRIAVYKGEFNEEFGAPLYVESFDDTQIDRFLHGYPWPNHLEMDTADRLLGVLHDTPQLMSLATSPLLLTMVAYLYAHTGKQLPHTRVDFYKKLVGTLLDDRSRFRHPRSVKLAALQRIALAAQGVSSGVRDWLGLEEKEVLRHVEEALADQRREVTPEIAWEVLEEIVQRTGLLLRIDGGVRYQFAHLTLQEYLAAAALAGDDMAILDRYRRDPAAWQETVRLWCGVEVRDCTQVVAEVLSQDLLLSFQCLADAHQVESDLSARIIEAALHLIDEEQDATSFRQMTTAFGVVASDSREPGPQVFQLLVERAQETTRDTTGRRAAMLALSATRMPRAAQILTGLLQHEPALVGDALVTMGNLAVPALMKSLDDTASVSQLIPVLRTLRRIATPRVAHALLVALHKAARAPSPVLGSTCAVFLGDLLREPDIERTLDQVSPMDPLRMDQLWPEEDFTDRAPGTRIPEDYMWVWQPFTQRPDSPLLRVAAVIAWWLEQEGVETRDGVLIDPRITVPLALNAGIDPNRIDSPPLYTEEDVTDEALGFFHLTSYQGRGAQLASAEGVRDLLRNSIFNGMSLSSTRDHENLRRGTDLWVRSLQTAPFSSACIRYLEHIPSEVRVWVLLCLKEGKWSKDVIKPWKLAEAHRAGRTSSALLGKMITICSQDSLRAR